MALLSEKDEKKENQEIWDENLRKAWFFLCDTQHLPAVLIRQKEQHQLNWLKKWLCQLRCWDILSLLSRIVWGSLDGLWPHVTTIGSSWSDRDQEFFYSQDEFTFIYIATHIFEYWLRQLWSSVYTSTSIYLYSPADYCSQSTGNNCRESGRHRSPAWSVPDSKSGNKASQLYISGRETHSLPTLFRLFYYSDSFEEALY